MSLIQTMSFLSNHTQNDENIQIFCMVKRLRREQIRHSENLLDLKDVLLEIKSQVRCQITIIDLFDQINRQQSCLLFVKDLCSQFKMKEINRKLFLQSLKRIKKLIFLCLKSKKLQKKINQLLEQISHELNLKKESLELSELQQLQHMIQKMLEKRLKFKYMFLERKDLREKIFDLQAENAKLKDQLPQKHSHQLEALLQILKDDSVQRQPQEEIKIQENEEPKLEQQLIAPSTLEQPTYVYYYFVPLLPYWPQYQQEQ